MLHISKIVNFKTNLQEFENILRGCLQTKSYPTKATSSEILWEKCVFVRVFCTLDEMCYVYNVSLRPLTLENLDRFLALLRPREPGSLTAIPTPPS